MTPVFRSVVGLILLVIVVTWLVGCTHEDFCDFRRRHDRIDARLQCLDEPRCQLTVVDLDVLYEYGTQCGLPKTTEPVER